MIYSQKPWRAHDTLFWFTVLGLGIATFAGLVAICVLAVGLTPWEIIVVRAETPAPMVTSSGALQIPLVDQLCLNDSDCASVTTVCGSCTCGEAVNKIYGQKYNAQYAVLCANVPPMLCEPCANTPRCINSRCVLAPTLVP